MTKFECSYCGHQQLGYGDCEDCGMKVTKKREISKEYLGRYNTDIESFEESCNKTIFDKRSGNG